jgi:signal transduction histidine kinase
VLGLVTATLLAALVGRLVARRAALWALAPLTSLRTSLETIRAREPRDAKLGGDDRIAEVRELRVALGGLLSRLGEALDAARGFSAEAAHELRTPLTTLSAELDLLAEEELPQEAREAVERLQRRTHDMTRLVERLLFLAEIEPLSDHGEPKGELDLRDLAFRVVDSLPHGAKERVVVRGEGDVRVHGDDVLLGALVENLVDNALKFSEHEVRLTVRPDGDVVVLEVADEGPGLATELDDQLFRPFVRGSDARARGTPGHGLGLGIVSRIAKAHGGEVSRVPEQSGATFRVRLPASRA